jgi:Phytanoyl-CoA dioxygenase (PhyH)
VDTTAAALALADDGFVVLRALIDPQPLADELDRAMRDAFGGRPHWNSGAAGNRFRYVPMMNERTPVSVALAVRLESLAAQLTHGAVLAARAKGTTYLGGTNWHRDSQLPIRSTGFVCYLEPLDADSGALRVRPGSHRRWVTSLDADHATPFDPADPGVALTTAPGDVIVFDEHLLHASDGGSLRRQWRVDFVADTDHDDSADGTHDHDAHDHDADGASAGRADEVLRAYFAGQHAPGWDGGYDADRYPSYSAHWRMSNPRGAARLDALGATRAAEAEEAWMKANRPPQPAP